MILAQRDSPPAGRSGSASAVDPEGEGGESLRDRHAASIVPALRGSSGLDVAGGGDAAGAYQRGYVLLVAPLT